jgi:hypothetical protein
MPRHLTILVAELRVFLVEKNMWEKVKIPDLSEMEHSFTLNLRFLQQNAESVSARSTQGD